LFCKTKLPSWAIKNGQKALCGKKQMTAQCVIRADPVPQAGAKENFSHRYLQIFTEILKFLNDENLRTLNQCLSVKISG